jgi:hypothetical protein
MIESKEQSIAEPNYNLFLILIAFPNHPSQFSFFFVRSASLKEMFLLLRWEGKHGH